MFHSILILMVIPIIFGAQRLGKKDWKKWKSEKETRPSTSQSLLKLARILRSVLKTWKLDVTQTPVKDHQR